MAKGFIFYEGKSVLDGEPVVGVGTWDSMNPKTGFGMLQTWILRADISPVDAVRERKDYSICGDCRWKHVSGEAPICYVQRFQAPQRVYTSYASGKYTYRFPERIRHIPVRLGAYGDPYALPVIVWDRLMERLHTTMWSGYTQFWGVPDAAALQKYCMASVATEREALEAHKLGWRTYRILVPDAELLESEVMCPHYTNGVQCVNCRLCNGIGNGAKSIAAPIHGARAKRFVEWHKKKEAI